MSWLGSGYGGWYGYEDPQSHCDKCGRRLYYQYGESTCTNPHCISHDFYAMQEEEQEEWEKRMKESGDE